MNRDFGFCDRCQTDAIIAHIFYMLSRYAFEPTPELARRYGNISPTCCGGTTLLGGCNKAPRNCNTSGTTCVNLSPETVSIPWFHHRLV